MNTGEHCLNWLRSRRSVRRFLAAEIPADVLQQVLEAACWAPSAGNRQDWEFLVVMASAMRAQMAAAVADHWRGLLAANADSGVTEELQRYAGNFSWFAEAPVVIVVTAKRAERFLRQLVGDEAATVAGSRTSAAMAAQNLMLAAHVLGLGSCCLTGPLAADRELRAVLGLGQRRELVCLIALGWPAEEPPAPPRKPVTAISRYLA